MNNPVVAAKDLKVLRQKTRALDGVSFELRAGKITGLIGPSGSGKTTLMRAIVGAQKITSGTLEVLGGKAGNKHSRSRIGYVTQYPAVYGDLTARQNLRYFATILGVEPAAADYALRRVDLSSTSKQLVETMSGGQKARVSLAIALMGEPELVVLDEPTVGLDPVLRKHLWELFAKLANQGQTLLISSHVMDEAEQCPELMILRDGKLLIHAPKKDVLQKTSTKTIHDAFLVLAGERI